MKLPIFQIDAFTSALFGGNPAAVVLLDEWLPDETLQAVGLENNLSETAFVVPGEDAFGLRWFTPEIEVDLCGHATLASAFVLFNEGRVQGETVRFESPSGPLSVTRAGEIYNLDFPSRPPEPAAITPELVAALGAEPKEVHGARDLLVVYENEEAIRSLKPRFELLGALDAFAVCVTAPGGSGSAGGSDQSAESDRSAESVDFVSRFFAPAAGINEDPVTGSAHCTLIPFWARRLGKRELRAAQLSRRGGEVFCRDCGDRVLIGGRAVEYMRGEICL